MRRINKRRIIYLIIIVVSSIIMMAFSLKTIIDIFRTMDESIVEQEIIRTEKYFYKNLDDIKNFGNLLSLRKDLVIAQQSEDSQWIEENIFQTLLHIDGNYVIGVINGSNVDSVLYLNKKIIENIQNQLKPKMKEIKLNFKYPYIDYIVNNGKQYQVYLSIISDPYGGQSINSDFIIILKELDTVFFKQLNNLLNIDTQVIINSDSILSSNFKEYDKEVVNNMNKNIYSEYQQNSGVLYQKKKIYNQDNEYLFDLQIKKVSSVRIYLLSGLMVLILPLFQIALVILVRLIINWFTVIESNKLIKDAKKIYEEEKDKFNKK